MRKILTRTVAEEDLLKLDGVTLARLYDECRKELRRRTLAETAGCDDAVIIKGNEMAKRALVVAAAGNHDILFIGPTNAGKSMFRALALRFDVIAFEYRPCPCGYYGEYRHDCKCSVKQIEKHRAAMPHCDITVDVPIVPEREMKSKLPGTSLAEMTSTIASTSKHTSLEVDSDGEVLLRAAVSELGIDPDGRGRILSVARTIANMDRSENIRNHHLCEAINYQTTWYRRLMS